MLRVASPATITCGITRGLAGRLLAALLAVAPAISARAANHDAAASRIAAGAEPVGGAFTQDMLLRDVGGSLMSHFNLGGELQLELLRPWNPPAGPASAWRFEVLEYPPGASSAMLIRGRVLADGKPAGDFTLVLRAAVWRDAWVTRQPVGAGTMLEPSSLEVRRVDVLRDREAVPVEQGDSGYVFARQVGAGRVITWRDLVRRPLVRKGELVEVEAGEGMLLITMKAVAMENGARGDTITLRNLESRKNFSALVVHENRVQVRF